MNVISKRGLLERSAKFADAKSALQVWFDTAVEAEWRNLEDVRKSFPATDMVGDLAIFNIRGNHYRLIVRMVFPRMRASSPSSFMFRPVFLSELASYLN